MTQDEQKAFLKKVQNVCLDPASDKHCQTVISHYKSSQVFWKRLRAFFLMNCSGKVLKIKYTLWTVGLLFLTEFSVSRMENVPVVAVTSVETTFAIIVWLSPSTFIVYQK